MKHLLRYNEAINVDIIRAEASLTQNIEGLLVELVDLGYNVVVENYAMIGSIAPRLIVTIKPPLKKYYIDSDVVRDYILTVVDFMKFYNGEETPMKFYYEFKHGSTLPKMYSESDELDFGLGDEMLTTEIRKRLCLIKFFINKN